MRLGDLDALYDKVSDHVTSVSVCATVQQAIGQTDFKWRCLEDIHNAPTIDAIPIELAARHLGRSFHSEPEKWADWLRMIRDDIPEEQEEEDALDRC